MRTVRIAGTEVTYPTKCACCAQPATTTLEVRKEDLKRLALAAVASAAIASDGGPSSLGGKLRSSRAIVVPYCAACIGHVRWRRLGGWVGVGLSLIVNTFFGLLGGGVAGMVVSMSSDDPKSRLFEITLAVCVLIGIAMSLAQLRFRPSGVLRAPHVPNGGDAVEIAAFSGDSITLKCHNNTFAAELVKANPGVATGA